MESVRVERFYLACLAHASYLIASGRVAAVIDPQRDIDIYLQTAADLGATIKYVIETHLHADFVSGHRELAERTGAQIYIGERSGAAFPHTAVKDGDSIQFGECRLDFLQTPGHTLESVCVLLTDRGQPTNAPMVFTGDTLFIGDVGRPDLSPIHTPQQLAGLLYRSLQEKLLTLPDETEVLPAHGAGSLCGRQMSSERSSTIGKERRFNDALQARSCEEFVRLLTQDLPARPEYFAREVELNRQGAGPLRSLAPVRRLSAGEVLSLLEEGAVAVDTRPAWQFSVGHVPGSLHIALTGQYASWAARILGLDSPVIIVGEDDQHTRESQIRLARVGIEKVLGYLEGGVMGWRRAGRELQTIPQITVQDLSGMLADHQQQVGVLDVREPRELDGGVIENATAIPLGELSSRQAELARDRLLVVHCKGGYRSSIATSLLRRAGFREVANLIGGFDAWLAAGLPVRRLSTPGFPAPS